MGEVPESEGESNTSPTPALAFVVALALWSPADARRARAALLAEGEPPQGAARFSVALYKLAAAWEAWDALGVVPWGANGIGDLLYAQLRAIACLYLVELHRVARESRPEIPHPSSLGSLSMPAASYLIDALEGGEDFAARMQRHAEGVSVRVPPDLIEASPPGAIVLIDPKYHSEIAPDPARAYLVRAELLCLDVRALRIRIAEGDMSAVPTLDRLEAELNDRPSTKGKHGYRAGWTAVMEALQRVADRGATRGLAEATRWELDRLRGENPEWGPMLDESLFARAAEAWCEGGSASAPKWPALVDLLLAAGRHPSDEDPREQLNKDKLHAHWKYIRRESAAPGKASRK